MSTESLHNNIIITKLLLRQYCRKRTELSGTPSTGFGLTYSPGTMQSSSTNSKE